MSKITIKRKGSELEVIKTEKGSVELSVGAFYQFADIKLSKKQVERLRDFLDIVLEKEKK